MIERVPCETCVKETGASKESATHDDVVRIVELEEKGLAGTKRSEATIATGLPEIHLVQVWTVPQKAVPIAVCDGDIRSHGRGF